MKKVLLLLVLLLMSTLFDARACTTFIINDSTNLIYGRNFDWDIGLGFIVINKRGIKKRALVQPPNKPAVWVSKYGSISFNQVGVDAPMGGMNERGLVIAQMGLFESKFPENNDKVAVSVLEWIQFQLDNSSTLEEVIKNNEEIRIAVDIVPVHYLICDSQGNVGIIEYINGKLVIHQGSEITIPVCSNISYNKSKSVLKTYKGFGGEKDIPTKWNNINDVIAIANSKIKNYMISDNKNPIKSGFEILKSVSSKTRTQWSIVFDIKNKNIHFNTLSNNNIRVLNLNDFDYSSKASIQILDIHTSNNKSNILNQFSTLTFEYYFNYKKELISSYKKMIKGFPDIPNEILKQEVEYALNRKCE